MNRPWKTSIRKIPDPVRNTIDSLDGRAFVLFGVRKIAIEDINSQLAHLGVSASASADIDAPEAALPDPTAATWAGRNVRDGFVKVHRGQPKTTKTWNSQTPNFGDWGKGSHTTSWSKEVYQRDTVGPHGWTIKIDLLHSDDTTATIGFELDHVFDRSSIHEQTLFFAANLLQESAGVLDVRESGTPISAFIASLSIEWEILPPGEIETIVSEIERRLQPNEEERSLLFERMQVLTSLQPTAFITGNSGFARYVGAQFKDNLVVFENIRYGNAAYVMYENWQELSQLSRVELIGSDNHFTRIPHTRGWQQKLRGAVREGLRST